jgi:hypothetical protein
MGNPKPPLKEAIQCVPILINELIEYTSEESVNNACCALYHISEIKNACIQRIIDYDGLNPLVQLMTQRSSPILISVLRTIGNIVSGTVIQTCKFIKSNNGLANLLTLMDHKDKSIRKEVFLVLRKISARNITQIQALIDTEIFLQMFQRMKSEEENEVVNEMIWVLCNSTSIASEEQFLYLVEKGVLELIVDFLSQEKIEVKMKKILIDGLANILAKDERYITQFLNICGFELLGTEIYDECLKILSKLKK